ncbi:MAG: M23 family metallopeptidase [Endomicrobiales bacterium]|nr:M23 family metallopeptidase [Endomicrobiales bacterium]
MISNEIDPEVIISFAEIFAWQIDFLTEPRVGDVYKLVWEKTVTEHDGKTIEEKIIGAQYIASGHTNTAILFEHDNNKTGYYNINGDSLFKAFLKAPLQYRRISSFFSNRRFHPILKIYRPHHGIDYAAPIGTPVSAIGNGKVIFAGKKGGYGRLIRIKHSNGFESYYGHLHGYARGIKTGSYINQGQVIGYVGSSGLSTGPHLDFRMKKHGKFVNFLKLKIPPSKKIPEKEKPEFKKAVKNILTLLAKID